MIPWIHGSCDSTRRVRNGLLEPRLSTSVATVVTLGTSSDVPVVLKVSLPFCTKGGNVRRGKYSHTTSKSLRSTITSSALRRLDSYVRKIQFGPESVTCVNGLHLVTVRGVINKTFISKEIIQLQLIRIVPHPNNNNKIYLHTCNIFEESKSHLITSDPHPFRPPSIVLQPITYIVISISLHGRS